ncbi:MAG: ABC transporter ATP-binding protein [Chloroflexi bacterium]|nr:ABC transporter ATP-binding protein [Chloroflexota bacterium]
MTTINFDHVSKYRESPLHGGQIPVVDDVTLKVHTGQIVTILGPSGSGKSTLLRLAAGLIAPDEGRILFDERLLQDIPKSERGVGMVFQGEALAPHWETHRSVGLFFALRHRDEELSPRLERITEITGFGLNQLLARRPGQLSGGERQRIQIARALARDLDILLFDEPFANIDAQQRSQARRELVRLLNEFPTTSLYVTHDQQEAMTIGQRVAVMRQGHLEQIGRYQDLYHTPVNRFVAEFIGQLPINLFEGWSAEGRWNGHSFDGLPFRRDWPKDQPVQMGVRPDSFIVDEDGIEVAVEEITPFFAERFAYAIVSARGESWGLHVPLDKQLRVGDSLRCRPDPERVMFFDPATERRIG